MDIRNITKESPKVIKGNYLEAMYELQKELMEGYITIENLPNYPLNINHKKHQIVLKDFSARVMEELAEGYESTHLAMDMLTKVGFNTSLLSRDDFRMLVNHLQNSNEEQADATAFFLEMMIYADINPSDFIAFIKDEGHSVEEDNLLETLMIYGLTLTLNVRDLPLRFNILKLEDFDSEEEYNKVRGYIPGFTELSTTCHDIESSLLWQVCYHLGVARNYLKNKPWKQSGELTDERPYIRETILAFIKYMGYLNYMGFTPDSLYKLFWRKNQVNQFRQKSRY